MKIDLPAYACHERAHTHKEMRAHRQQGEVKAINVSELAMHHASALIDRWHQESVPVLHTHTPLKMNKKGGEGSYSRTNMSTATKQKKVKTVRLN